MKIVSMIVSLFAVAAFANPAATTAPAAATEAAKKVEATAADASKKVEAKKEEVKTETK